MIESIDDKPNVGKLYLRVYKKRNKKKDIRAYELTNEEVEKIDNLNNYLIKFEHELKEKFNSISKWAQNINLYVDFHLSEDDDFYMHDEDNRIISLTDWNVLGDYKQEWGIADGKCHNIVPVYCVNKIRAQKHCSIMHSLYDHTDLSWDEILRIGAVSYKIEIDSDIEEIKGL